MPGNHAIQKIRGEPRKQVDINPNIFMLPYNRGCMFQEKHNSYRLFTSLPISLIDHKQKFHFFILSLFLWQLDIMSTIFVKPILLLVWLLKRDLKKYYLHTITTNCVDLLFLLLFFDYMLLTTQVALGNTHAVLNKLDCLLIIRVYLRVNVLCSPWKHIYLFVYGEILIFNSLKHAFWFQLSYY